MDYQSYYEKKDDKSTYEKSQDLNDVMNDIAEGVLTLVVGSDSSVEIVTSKDDEEDDDE